MPYSHIISPTVTTYDAATGALLGKATFTLTAGAEKALLDWANFRTPIPPFTVVDWVFVPTEMYVPIIPITTYHRKGVFGALYTPTYSVLKIPLEMRGTYDWRARSAAPGNYIQSAEFSNIIMDPLQETLY